LAATSGDDVRLIIVSNRGPVSFDRDDSGERTYSRGAGGLVTALTAVSRRRDSTWIATAMSEEDMALARETGDALEVEDLRVSFVEHGSEAYDLMYNHTANPLLWLVQHYLYNLPLQPELGDETRRAWEEGYLPVNRNFARAVARSVEEDERFPLILLHDYQLYLTPRYVREELRREAFISLFVHIPWPQPDYWRILPREMREAILWSLLQTDVLAFHTRRYARSFLDTVSQLLGLEVSFEKGVVYHAGREVWVRAYPISIDAGEFAEISEREEVLREEREYVSRLRGRLLIRVDRMDLSKNIVRGFQAYGRMLERHPEMKGEVTFLAQLQPSRGDIREYAEYAETVQDVISAVNAAYGTGDWQPIVLSMEDNFPRAVAAYRNYDAILVNPVFDGMNLVAKESAVVNRKDGVLILSENAGAYEELGEHALTVNPFDLDEQAEAIYRALTMSEDERRRRAEGLRQTVRSNTIEDWVEAQFDDIREYMRQHPLRS
jgi:trehalose 6-phosphate synthase